MGIPLQKPTPLGRWSHYRPTNIQVFWIALACVAIALALGYAWGDRPVGTEHQLSAAVAPGYVTDSWRDQLRGRTLKQGESGRIYS